MLEELAAPSPFFRRNKATCDELAAICNRLHVEYTGICDSYGFELTTSFRHNGLHFTYCFEKGQYSTGVDESGPARNHAYTTIEISGQFSPSRVYKLRYGYFLRLFSDPRSKAVLPPPFWLRTTFRAPDYWLNELVAFIEAYTVIRITLKPTKLKLTLRNTHTDLFPLSEECVRLLTAGM